MFFFLFSGFGYRRGFSVSFALSRSDLRLVLLLRAFMRGNFFFLSFFWDFPAIFFLGVFSVTMSSRLFLLGEGWAVAGWRRMAAVVG